MNQKTKGEIPIPESYYNQLWQPKAQAYIEDKYPKEKLALEIANSYKHFIGFVCDIAIQTNDAEFEHSKDLLSSKEIATTAMFNQIDQTIKTFDKSQILS